jgi:hypothetical protein
MRIFSALIAANNAAIQLAAIRAGSRAGNSGGNQESSRSTRTSQQGMEEGMLLGWRSRTGGSLKLDCPHIFDELGTGTSAHVKCCLCGGEMDHEPGDPSIWR